MPSEPMNFAQLPVQADASDQDAKIAETDNSNRPADGAQDADQDPCIEYVDDGDVL